MQPLQEDPNVHFCRCSADGPPIVIHVLRVRVRAGSRTDHNATKAMQAHCCMPLFEVWSRRWGIGYESTNPLQIPTANEPMCVPTQPFVQCLHHSHKRQMHDSVHVLLPLSKTATTHYTPLRLPCEPHIPARPPGRQTWRPTSRRRVSPDLEGGIKILEVGTK